MSEMNPNIGDKELLITRIFDAPREILWKAWTEPERVKCWWGPKNFTAPVSIIDLRVGGTYLYCMRSPEGQDFWSTGIYREIIEPELIVCTGQAGNRRPSAGSWADCRYQPASHIQ